MRPAILPLVALLIAGCGEDVEVRRYRAPKDPTWTMLGAILPRERDVWFFKVVAPTKRLAPHRESFTAFLESVRHDEEVAWTLPDGWSEDRTPEGEREATLTFGERPPPLELSVTRFGGDGGGVLANVNRWRRQMGLPGIEASDLDGATETVGKGIVRVELVSRTPPPPPRRMSNRAAPRRSEPRFSKQDLRALFTFDLPEGWVENPEPPGERIVELRAGEAVVALTHFQGTMGGLGPNVNRWRRQVGLPPADDAEGLAEPFTLMGRPGHLVELNGTDRAILCAFILGDPFSLFLKMDGPAGAVAAQREAFRSFASSFTVAQ